MSSQADSVRVALARCPATARQLTEMLKISQPTLSRILTSMGEEVVRFGAARSIQYALRDGLRGLPDIPVYRVDVAGQVRELGVLIAVRPEGFVMRQADGVTLHSEGLPWWLLDMRPQGFLGRAFAAQYGPLLGLPSALNDWHDSHVLRALLAHGDDVVGNLLLGEQVRNRYVSSPTPQALAIADKATVYPQLAHKATAGEVAGTSAGGEQPKFTVYAETQQGARHLIVKFSEAEASPVSERWRDLLLAEHLALKVLRDAGISAAQSALVDCAGQRFLETVRFDREGSLGRRALHTLTALDAEFVGVGDGGWPLIARRLADAEVIPPEAVNEVGLLWAFGVLIGNTDRHNANLAFIAEHGRPYGVAPAYDMLPMAFAPRSGGGLPDSIPAPHIYADIAHATWQNALPLAQAYLEQLQRKRTSQFSPCFSACISALDQHLNVAMSMIARLG